MKKMKKINKSILLSSLAVLAFGGIAVSTTYALFTSKAETNVTVTSGKVSVVAEASELKTYSGTNLVGDATDVLAETDVAGVFANGGTAVLNGTKLTLSNVTPGDKVTFKLKITNYSNVLTKYRTKLTASNDTGLFDGLKLDIAGAHYSNLGDWADLAVANEDGTLIGEYDCTVELPSVAENSYQGKSCTIDFGVEAIQGNAATYKVVEVSNESELRTALYNAPTSGIGVNVVLKDNITLDMAYSYELYNHSADDGIANMDDYEEGDTLSHYKYRTSDWDEVNASDNDKASFGAKYYCVDTRVGRLVVKKNQDVIIDLNGHTLMKNPEATHGDWQITNTDIIANYGKLKVTDTSSTAGTLKGNGYYNCGGAVLHNYAGGTLSVEKVNVDGNAANMTQATGQSSIINEGGAVTIDSASVYDTPATVTASLIKNKSGVVTIKGNSVLSSVKILNCEGGRFVVDSGTLTTTTDTGYAIKAEGMGSVEINDENVTVTGKEKTEGTGSIIHK